MTQPSTPPVRRLQVPRSAARSFDAALPPWARPRPGEPRYEVRPPADQHDLLVAVARALAAVGIGVVDVAHPLTGGAVLTTSPRGGVLVGWMPHPVLLAEPEHETTAHVVTETMDVALHEVLIDLGFVVGLLGTSAVPHVTGRTCDAPDRREAVDRPPAPPHPHHDQQESVA